MSTQLGQGSMLAVLPALQRLGTISNGRKFWLAVLRDDEQRLSAKRTFASAVARTAWREVSVEGFDLVREAHDVLHATAWQSSRRNQRGENMATHRG